jgi:hypothetical protein
MDIDAQNNKQRACKVEKPRGAELSGFPTE